MFPSFFGFVFCFFWLCLLFFLGGRGGGGRYQHSRFLLVSAFFLDCVGFEGPPRVPPSAEEILAQHGGRAPDLSDLPLLTCALNGAAPRAVMRLVQARANVNQQRPGIQASSTWGRFPLLKKAS